VALDETDNAIGVLDAVNEKRPAVRGRPVASHRAFTWPESMATWPRTPTPCAEASLPTGTCSHPARPRPGRPGHPALADRTESRHFYRMQADWWYAAYRLSRAQLLPAGITWPDNTSHTNDPERSAMPRDKPTAATSNAPRRPRPRGRAGAHIL